MWLLVKATHMAVASVGHLVGGLETNVAFLGWGALKFLQRCRDFILFDNLCKLTSQICIKFMSIMTLFFGITTVEDANFFVGVVKLPSFTLVLFKEIYDKKWMLEVDEEVAHVGHLLWLFLISNNVEGRVATLVSDVYLIFELFLRVATRDVLNAQISPQVLALLHEVDPDRLTVGVAIRLGRLAAIL